VTHHAILVLGMHRSGTSALTRMINLLGASLPGQLMPEAADNPRGYWESKPIAQFNNRLLQSAGSRWNDDGTIAPEWFSAAERQADGGAALELLEQEFGNAPVVVFKDPRLCRLLPFWQPLLRRSGRELHAVLMLRDPLEVVRSLQARLHDEATRPAAVAATARGLLLWLRHVLDAERHSRQLPRAVVDYGQLLADWRLGLAALQVGALLPLPDPDAATAAAIDAHLNPDLRRQRPATADDLGGLPGLALARALHQRLRQPGALRLAAAGAPPLEALQNHLDDLVATYAPLRRDGQVSRDSEDPWGELLLGQLEQRQRRSVQRQQQQHHHEQQRQQPEPPPRILFVSGVPQSAGHVYRVEQPLAALRAGGWQGDWCDLEAVDLEERAAAASLVCVFRAPWGPVLERLAAACRAGQIPLLADIDDLIFDRQLMEEGQVDYLNQLPAADRQSWLEKADGYKQTLARADTVLVSTAPLAAAAAGVNPRVHQLNNGLSEAMLAAAEQAQQQPRPSSGDGLLRLGFASGTPSHQRDFAAVADVIARLLERRPELRLVLVGLIDPTAYPGLAAHAERIERRPKVSLLELHGEMARFDINLAPLEAGNRFCTAKSAIRVSTAAAVGVPSVASPTPPIQEAIVAGHSGLLARSAEEWEAALEQLLDQPELRLAMGAAARLDVINRYGWRDWAEQACSVYGAILAEASTASGGIHMASP
jgi:hypothetical protein